MTQTARPIQDISEGSWTPMPLWPQIGAVVPNTATPDTSSNNPVSDTFEVQLSKLYTPGPGSQTLTVELEQSGTGTFWVSIALIQGTQIIASRIVKPTGSFVPYTLTLSQQQIAQITDYTNLHVRITAGAQVTTGCPQCTAAPLQWQLIASGFSGAAACSMANGTFILNYVSGCQWEDTNGIWGLNWTGTIWSLNTVTILPGANRYELSGSSFNCLGSNTLTFTSGPGGCPTHPATLTITPV